MARPVEASIPRREASMKSTTIKRVVLFLAAFSFASVLWTVRGGAQRPHSRAEFMRTKLEYSKKALEGLALEDYETIARSARSLRLLSQAAEWEVPTIPNATDYVVFTREFQQLSDEMARKAKEKNIDGATLAYLRLTLNCVNCHKYVRELSR
jgi:hypothetical protein